MTGEEEGTSEESADSPADELLLRFATAAGGRTAAWHVELSRAVAGAVLVDLVLRARVAVETGRVRVLSCEPVADPVADWFLRRLAAGPERSAEAWIDRLAHPVFGRVQQHLVDREMLVPVRRSWRHRRLSARMQPVRDRGRLSPLLVDVLGGLLSAAGLGWAHDADAGHRPCEPFTRVFAAVEDSVRAAACKVLSPW